MIHPNIVAMNSHYSRSFWFPVDVIGLFSKQCGFILTQCGSEWPITLNESGSKTSDVLGSLQRAETSPYPPSYPTPLPLLAEAPFYCHAAARLGRETFRL